MRTWSLCLLSLTMLGPAFADESTTPWYIGLGAGATEIEGEGSFVGQTASEISENPLLPDDKSNGLRGIIGYKINENFAAEFEYADFGDAKSSTGIGQNRLLSVASDIKALSAFVVGEWPVTSYFSVYGRVGYSYGDLNFERSQSDLSGNTPPVRAFDSDDDTDFVFGLGLNFRAGRGTLRLAFDSYRFDFGVLEPSTRLGLDFLWSL